MEKKQTAVEWLLLRISIAGVAQGTGLSVDEIIEQAKKMEKEQIEDAHYEGQCDNHEGYPKFISEQYYNETYGNQTDRS